MKSLPCSTIGVSRNKGRLIFVEGRAILPQDEDSDDKPLIKFTIEDIEEQESSINESLTFKLLVKIVKTLFSLYILTTCVFFTEYISLSYTASEIKRKFLKKEEIASKANPTESKMALLIFEIFQVFFQAGILIARSSLDCCKIRQVGLLVFVLFLLGIGFFVMSLFEEIYSIWVPLWTLFLIGIFGGFGFANVFHQVLEHGGIKKKERELAVNLNMIFASFGIVSSFLVGYLLQFVWRSLIF